MMVYRNNDQLSHIALLLQHVVQIPSGEIALLLLHFVEIRTGEVDLGVTTE